MDEEIFSNELKKMSGFGKGGEKGFDGTITNLMMQFYLCNCDFQKRKNKQGQIYGWDVAVYSSLELDKKKIVLDDPIKELGSHKVKIKLHKDVTANVTVNVIEG